MRHAAVWPERRRSKERVAARPREEAGADDVRVWAGRVLVRVGDAGGPPAAPLPGPRRPGSRRRRPRTRSCACAARPSRRGRSSAPPAARTASARAPRGRARRRRVPAQRHPPAPRRSRARGPGPWRRSSRSPRRGRARAAPRPGATSRTGRRRGQTGVAVSGWGWTRRAAGPGQQWGSWVGSTGPASAAEPPSDHRVRRWEASQIPHRREGKPRCTVGSAVGRLRQCSARVS